MKTKLLFAFFIILIGFVCCHKENNSGFQSDGKITGFDARMCACCGGTYIEIDGVTYEFDSLPVSSNVNLQKDTFPILVKLDWQLSDKVACPDKRITILKILKK